MQNSGYQQRFGGVKPVNGRGPRAPCAAEGGQLLKSRKLRGFGGPEYEDAGTPYSGGKGGAVSDWENGRTSPGPRAPRPRVGNGVSAFTGAPKRRHPEGHAAPSPDRRCEFRVRGRRNEAIPIGRAALAGRSIRSASAP